MVAQLLEVPVSSESAEWDEPGVEEEPALDQLFELLERMDVLEGFKIEIIEGAIVLSPQRSVHWKIILSCVMQIKSIGKDTEVFSDVRIDFPGYRNGFAPDVAKLRDAAEPDERGKWSFRDVEFVAEVVSRESRDNDYGRKKAAYAAAEVPIYLIADPYTAECHVHTSPEDGHYGGEVKVPFGDVVDLREAGLDVRIDTADFPTG